MVELHDRISDVLARDRGLVDVFVSVSPAFEKLRHRGIARVMTKLVTVEQAARIAKVDPGHLRDRLNAALGLAPAAGPAPVSGPGGDGQGAAEAAAPPPPIPAAVLALAPGRVVDLDVREDLRSGREPFGRITREAGRLPEGHALRLRVSFEPVPLYGALAKRGFGHHVEQLGEDHWRVWFLRVTDAAVSEPEHCDPVPVPECGDRACVTLDVRGLEPPEPMVRTLQALEALPRGATLVQINERVPRFLLPKLMDGGFEYEARRADDGTVHLHIRHRREETA